MTKSKESTLLLVHLGLGDAVIVNSITRAAVKAYGKVSLPCKRSNLESVGFMYRDLGDDLTLIEVPDKTHRGGEDLLIEMAKKWKGCVHNLTMFNRMPTDPWFSDEETCFDTNFYRWAGMEIEDKFSGFRCDRDKSIEIPVPDGDYIFMHDEPQFSILRDMAHPRGLPVFHAHDFKIGNIFALRAVIENAAELHMINSGPLNLTDFLKPKGKLVWHQYSRKEISYPTLQLDWNILK